MRTVFVSTAGQLGLVMVAAVVFVALVACTGEDRPGVTVVSEETVSVSGTGTGVGHATATGGRTGTGTATGTGTGTGTATGTDTGTATGAEPGVVGPKPPGAEQLTVELGEWYIRPDRTEIHAGEVYLLAKNRGEEPHEVVVIRSDSPVEALPVEEGRVPEDEVDLVGEVEVFAAGTEASGVFELAPGRYILLCNIAEHEDGELESHFEEGMHAVLEVEESESGTGPGTATGTGTGAEPGEE